MSTFARHTLNDLRNAINEVLNENTQLHDENTRVIRDNQLLSDKLDELDQPQDYADMLERIEGLQVKNADLEEQLAAMTDQLSTAGIERAHSETKLQTQISAGLQREAVLNIKLDRISELVQHDCD